MLKIWSIQSVKLLKIWSVQTVVDGLFERKISDALHGIVNMAPYNEWLL